MIHRVLMESKEFAATHSLEQTRSHVVASIDAVPGLRVEYYEIIDADTMMPVDNWAEAAWVVGCITVYCGEIRLIDNITYKNQEGNWN